MTSHPLSMPASIGLLVLRVGIGGFMATHGWGKLMMLVNGESEQLGDPIGIGSPASVILVMLAEFVCALLVVFGLATRFAAAPIVMAMAVAAFVVHASDPLLMETAAMQFFAGESESWASKEPALLYLIPFLSLIFTGAGRYSIDAVIAARRSPAKAA